MIKYRLFWDGDSAMLTGVFKRVLSSGVGVLVGVLGGAGFATEE